MLKVEEDLYIKLILQEFDTVGILNMSDNQMRILANRSLRAASALDAERRRMEAENDNS